MAKKTVEVKITAKDLTASVVAGFQRRWRAMSRVVSTVTRGLVAFTAAGTAAVFTLTKLGQRGDEVNAVKRAFARITGDETAALNQLRKASNGTIADFKLMSLANQAMALGAAKSAEQYAEMVFLSRELGRAQGIDATTALEKFTVALARQSALRADDLGLNLQGIEASKFAAVFMEQAREKVEALTGGMKAGTDWALRFTTALTNLKDALSTLVSESPQIATFFGSIVDFVDDFTDILRKDSGTIVEAFKALGAMAGNAFGAAYFQAMAATLNMIDKALLPKWLEEKLATVFGVFGGGAQALADQLSGNVGAWRGVLGSLANAPDRPTAGAGGGGGGFGGGGVGPIGLPTGRSFPSTLPADAIARFRRNRDRRLNPRFGMANRPEAGPVSALRGLTADQQAALDARNEADTIRQASDEVKYAKQVVVASMFGMAQAAIRGSGQVAESVISMMTQIAQSIPKVSGAWGGFLGPVIGGVGGLLSAAFSRGRDRAPVRVAVSDFEAKAERQLRDAGSGPLRITVINEVGGVTMDVIERELRDRQNRDEVVRFGPRTAAPLTR